MKARKVRRQTKAALFSAAALYWELHHINPELPGRLLAALRDGQGERWTPEVVRWAEHTLLNVAEVLGGATQSGRS